MVIARIGPLVVAGCLLVVGCGSESPEASSGIDKSPSSSDAATDGAKSMLADQMAEQLATATSFFAPTSDSTGEQPDFVAQGTAQQVVDEYVEEACGFSIWFE